MIDLYVIDVFYLIMKYTNSAIYLGKLTDTLPFNPYFNGFEPLVHTINTVRSEEKLDRKLGCQKVRFFSDGEPKALLELCKKHGEQFRNDIGGSEYVLALMHPLFPFLSDWDAVQNEGDNVVQEYYDYLSRLNAALEKIKVKEKVDVLLVETPEHYAAATSHLVEDGNLVDRVIFTQLGRGSLLDPDQYKELHGTKRIFLGGSYTDICILIGAVQIRTRTEGTVSIIPELTVSSPKKIEISDSEKFSKLDFIPNLWSNERWLVELGRLHEFGFEISSLEELLKI